MVEVECKVNAGILDRCLCQCDEVLVLCILSCACGNLQDNGGAQLFRRLAARFPASDRTKECAIYAAWSNYLDGRYGEALEIAARLRDEGNEDAAYLVAASLRKLERRQDAVDAYSLALAKFPRGRHADTEWFERLTVLAASGDNAAVLDELAKRPDPPAKTSNRAWSYGC